MKVNNSSIQETTQNNLSFIIYPYAFINQRNRVKMKHCLWSLIRIPHSTVCASTTASIPNRRPWLPPGNKRRLCFNFLPSFLFTFPIFMPPPARYLLKKALTVTCKKSRDETGCQTKRVGFYEHRLWWEQETLDNNKNKKNNFRWRLSSIIN